MPEFRTQVPSLLRRNYPRSSPEPAVILAVHLHHSCPAVLSSHSYRPQELPVPIHERAVPVLLCTAFSAKLLRIHPDPFLFQMCFSSMLPNEVFHFHKTISDTCILQSAHLLSGKPARLSTLIQRIDFSVNSRYPKFYI